jgi:glycosyltransferase involved in cell wall biosynthesis
MSTVITVRKSSSLDDLRSSNAGPIKISEKSENKNDTDPYVKMKVIVAVPAFNEEVSIGSIVLSSLKNADKVVVIDDGSSDNTSEIAHMASAEVISHKKNEGKGSSIKDAFEYAKKDNADILVLIDGDGQHNPDEIPKLLDPIKKGETDIINGSRYINGNGHNTPKYRRVGQEVLNLMTNAGTNVRITDSQSGFRAFSKRTFDSFTFHEHGMAIESEMLIDAANANLKIKEVPISVRYDIGNCSTYDPVSHGLSVLWKVTILISHKRPLVFFYVPGAILSIIGIAMAALVLNIFNQTRSFVPGYSVLAIICILLGFTSTFIGLTLNANRELKIQN